MNAEYLNSNDIDKKKWDEFIHSSPQGNIFALSWYMDIISPGWDAIVVLDGNAYIQAVFPLWVKRKYLIKYAYQPLHAKYWGVFFKSEEEGNTYKDYSYKNSMIQAILKKIPTNIRSISLNFSPAFDYPLPFKWSGFKILTNFTYYLDLKQDFEKIKASFKSSLRNKINNFKVEDFIIREEEEFDHMIDLINIYKSKRILNLTSNYQSLLEKAFIESRKKNCAKVVSAAKSEKEVIASVLFLYFKKTVYYFLGLVHSDHKSTAVIPYIISRELENCVGKFDVFDFQGSMIKNIENFNRSFGARPVPYYNVSKKRIL